jgi:DNA polymerase-3 subunit gamma/tau
MRFSEVLGQEGPLTTLKNALTTKTFAQAYLLCGPRGTGKTTLARLVARSLVCQNPDGIEPCGSCSACIDAMSSSSLDVIEIDGASNRGIDEIRKINETVAYAPSRGTYKIYTIDEVHMLTKEAFNALLKTLEEPPQHVVFLFATTEPERVPATILSRCQRLILERLRADEISGALKKIAAHLEITADEEALRLIARRADGSLRDAQSLFDQAAAFSNPITPESAAKALGVPSRDHFFAMDAAAKEGARAKAYVLAGELLQSGYSLTSLIGPLVDHFRSIALIHQFGPEAIPLIDETPATFDALKKATEIYPLSKTLSIIDFLIQSGERIAYVVSERAQLEMILMKIISPTPQAQAPVDTSPASQVPQPKTTHNQMGGEAEQKHASATRLPEQPQVDGASTTKEPHSIPPQSKGLSARDETVIRFAAVELEGRVEGSTTEATKE